ncbi:MAG: hypothetical protein JWM95_4083, partial [Gemmatimonadetes bacterium]|nr:hypothetical protein [Gemmatimonadota bacterium]
MRATTQRARGCRARRRWGEPHALGDAVSREEEQVGGEDRRAYVGVKAGRAL